MYLLLFIAIRNRLEAIFEVERKKKLNNLQ